jgi:hypothetical protein
MAENIPDMAKGKNVSVALKGLEMKLTGGVATITVFHPLPDDHPCYRLIGLIAAEAARIERLLDQTICYIAVIDLRVGACMTGQMIGPTPRFLALLQLALNRGMSAEIIKRINTVRGHAGEKFELRNRAVHDSWIADKATGEPYQFRGKSKQNPDFGPQPFSENALKDALAELRKYRDEVNALVSDIWTELQPASP